MNFLLARTTDHQEYVLQSTNAEVIKAFGQDCFDALKNGQEVLMGDGARLIDMTIAARAALSKPDAYRELLS